VFLYLSKRQQVQRSPTHQQERKCPINIPCGYYFHPDISSTFTVSFYSCHRSQSWILDDKDLCSTSGEHLHLYPLKETGSTVFQLIPQYMVKRCAITIGKQQFGELMCRLSKTQPNILVNLGVQLTDIHSPRTRSGETITENVGVAYVHC